MTTEITTVGIDLQTLNTTTKGPDAMSYVEFDERDLHDSSSGGAGDSSDGGLLIRADNGGNNEAVILMRFVIPSEEELIGRALNISGSGTFPRLTRIPSDGLKLEGATLRMARTNSGSATINVQVYELLEDFSENLVTWDSPNGNTASTDWNPAFDASTKIYENTLATASMTQAGANTLQNFILDTLIKSKKLTFGDKILLYIRTQIATQDFVIHGPKSSTSAAQPEIKVRFTCNPPIPRITVNPDTNGIDGLINITPPSDDAFITDGKFHIAWKTAADVVYNQSGQTTAFTDTGVTVVNTNEVAGDDSGGAGDLLLADGTNYYIAMFTEDGLSVDANSGQSNVVYIKRPEAAAALDDYSPDIGQEVTLTITPSNGLYSGKVKEFRVNWDSGTSDLDSDYSSYKLETASASAYTIKHKFHKVATFQVKVQVVDQDGWASDKTATATANTTTNEPLPVANLSLSREKVTQAKYLDRTTVITASLARSKVNASNRELSQYWFRYVPSLATTVCTSGAIYNDNSAFDNASSAVSFQAVDKTQDFSDSAIQVYGLASFTSGGVPIKDDEPEFDHYKYVTEKLFCSPTRLTDTVAKSSETAEANVGVSFYKYKTIEIVVGTAIASEDAGTYFTRYILSKFNADDAARTIINPSIRLVAKTGDPNMENLYAWGGFARILDSGVTFNASGKYIQAGSKDWQDFGFYVGDIVKVKDGNGTNGSYASPKFFKIKEFSASTGSGVGATHNRLVIESDSTLLSSHEKSYVSTSISDSSSATGEIVLDASDVPAITFAVYNNAGYDDTVTIHSRVCDNDEIFDNSGNEFFPFNESLEVSQTFRAVVPKTLDLDSLVDSSHIAILSSSISRSGGISAQMPLGDRKYPIGVVRTKVGNPKLSLNLRILSQTGLSNISSIVEGDVYDFVFLDSDKIDTPTAAFKSYRLRAESGSLSQDPSSATQYLATIEFSIIGEELQVA